MSLIATPPRKRQSSGSDQGGNGDNNNAIEAEDISGDSSNNTPGRFLKHLLQRMSPSNCLHVLSPAAAAENDDSDDTFTIPMGGGGAASSCHNPFLDPVDIEDIVVALLNDLKRPGKARTVALQKLYRLTDRERKENRIPVVCTTKFDIWSAVIPCLESDRRQALLLINNLCIPVENKAAILLGEPVHKLLPALLDIIRKRQAESYLATVCLFNLSFLDDAKSLLLYYVPDEQHVTHQGKQEYRQYAPTDNPISLLRTLESAMKDFCPYVIATSSSRSLSKRRIPSSLPLDATSVEGEACRWSMGIMRNLSTCQECALIIGTETTIPSLSIQCLHASLQSSIGTAVDADPSSSSDFLAQWKRDSLEDACLQLLVHLAQHDACLRAFALQNDHDQLLYVVQNLNGRGGIHETRANALQERLRAVVTDNDVHNSDNRKKHQDEKKEW